MRPERRFQCRNGKGRLLQRSPKSEDHDPDNLSLFEAQNGLDNGATLGIGLLTPAMVHFGETQIVLARRQAVLNAAYQAHPDRFVRRAPKPLPCPRRFGSTGRSNRPKGRARKSVNSRPGCLKVLDTRWPDYNPSERHQV